MHICFLTNEYPALGITQGGIGSFVQALAHELVKKGMDVSVVGWIENGTPEHEEDGGVKIYRYQRSHLRFLNVIRNAMNRNNLIQKIHEHNPIDIIEGSELNFAFLSDVLPGKKVIRMHGGHHFFAETTGKKRSLWRSYQEKRSFRNADAFVAVSEFVGNKTVELLNEKRVFDVIYNLIDTNKFYRADHNKIQKHTIVFIGTIVEKKGVKELVHAISVLLDKFPEVKLKLIGRDSLDANGHSFTELIQNTMDDATKEHVEFLGPKPHTELPRYIEEAEVCVYPSHMEAQGIVVVEAMSMGKAVVFSHTGPGTEMIEPKVNGLLCDPYNPEDIASQIALFFNDKVLAESCGEQARNSVLKRFDMDTIIEQNLQFYKRQL